LKLKIILSQMVLHQEINNDLPNDRLSNNK
jgi:hypothetical protein